MSPATVTHSKAFWIFGTACSVDMGKAKFRLIFVRHLAYKLPGNVFHNIINEFWKYAAYLLSCATIASFPFSCSFHICTILKGEKCVRNIPFKSSSHFYLCNIKRWSGIPIFIKVGSFIVQLPCPCLFHLAVRQANPGCCCATCQVLYKCILLFRLYVNQLSSKL